MSLVCESDAYRAYYNLCINFSKKPLRRSKWARRLQKSIKINKTVEDIEYELNLSNYYH